MVLVPGERTPGEDEEINEATAELEHVYRTADLPSAEELRPELVGEVCIHHMTPCLVRCRGDKVCKTRVDKTVEKHAIVILAGSNPEILDENRPTKHDPKSNKQLNEKNKHSTTPPVLQRHYDILAGVGKTGQRSSRCKTP